MTRVDFYVLTSTGPDDRTRFVCRLAEKAFLRKHNVFVNAASAAQADRLNELLWTFRDQSFVPHGLAEQGAEAPVVIGFDREPGDADDMLINLAASVPTFFSRFERMLEVVDGDPERRQQGRERFKFYRDRGYHLTTHKL